ncbi:hypothetical protein NDA01_26215 [Trichocoleus desertorum AS-A10]|uniref:hypothetical protein n=1 Tax=Trichocoleus desertorum TaxID=1481672 RepID=UPI00329813C7
MSQSPSDSEQPSEAPQPTIQQNSSGSLGGGQQAINGNNNSQYQDNRNFGVSVYLPPDTEVELPENLAFKSWRNRLCNYLKTVFFLFSVFVAWSFMGLFINQAFPKSLASSLVNYTFRGFWSHIKTPSNFLEITSGRMWEGIRRSIAVLPSLDSIKCTNDKAGAQELNKLDSQYWLLARLAENLQEGSEDFDDVFWKIRELEEERVAIASRLKPLKQVYLRNLDYFQKLISRLSFLLRRSKKHNQVEKILNEIVQRYIHIENASELQVQELIEFLENRTSQLPKTQSLYNVWRLTNWIHIQTRNLHFSELESPGIAEIDSTYPPVRALKEKSGSKPKFHVPNGCGHGYPRVEKLEDRENIDFYESIYQAEKAGREMCIRCKNNLCK